MKSCSTSLVIREMQIQLHTFQNGRNAEETTHTKRWWGSEQPEPPRAAGESVNWQVFGRNTKTEHMHT